MKKLIALGLGTCAVASATLISAGTASSSPQAGASPYYVIGEPYGKAVQILKSMGIKAVFGGAVGSDIQQSLCVVVKQKMSTSGTMILNLNCTEEAVKEAGISNSTGSGPGGVTIGANGVTTVTPTPMPMNPTGVPTSPAPVPPPLP